MDYVRAVGWRPASSSFSAIVRQSRRKSEMPAIMMGSIACIPWPKRPRSATTETLRYKSETRRRIEANYEARVVTPRSSAARSTSRSRSKRLDSCLTINPFCVEQVSQQRRFSNRARFHDTRIFSASSNYRTTSAPRELGQCPRDISPSSARKINRSNVDWNPQCRRPSSALKRSQKKPGSTLTSRTLTPPTTRMCSITPTRRRMRDPHHTVVLTPLPLHGRPGQAILKDRVNRSEFYNCAVVEFIRGAPKRSMIQCASAAGSFRH